MTAVAAAIPELAHACDTHRPWNEADDIVTEPARFDGGSLAVGRRPGLGVELDRTFIARLHEQYLAWNHEHRNDASYRRRIEPEFNAGLPRW